MTAGRIHELRWGFSEARNCAEPRSAARGNQGHAHSAVHRVATALTHAAVHEVEPDVQHEGMFAQIAATHALHPLLSCGPV